MSKIIVVGGGPSGMMAALNASKSNHEVILLERNGELGRKLLLTGGGRCNITNNRDIEDFFDKVVNNKKFLYSSFYSFTNKDLLSYFEENNLEYKIETDNDHKVYTKSDKSEEVIEALKSDLKANKVKILYNTKVVDLIIENNTVIGVKTENNQTILADKVIISTGGKSYPNTGSDGMMYEILKKYGHTINKIYPALIPLTVKESFIKKLQGISMRNVEISCKIKKKKISQVGDMLFAHFGLTGPAVLKFSSYINKYIDFTDRDMLTNKLGKISGMLKSLAMEEDICVVLMAQANRVIDKKVGDNAVEKIDSSDIQDSARIEQDSDQVIGLYRNVKLDDKMYRENLFNQGKLKYNSKNADDNPECMNAVIIKNRHGDRGTCALRWHGRYSRVSDF